MNADKNRILEINASGSYYNIGFITGRHTKQEIHQLLEKYEAGQPKDSQQGKLFDEYMAYVEPYAFITDELKGMADGAGVEFEQIARLNMVELNLHQSRIDDCSTFIIKNETTHLLAHNEDSIEGHDIFLLRARYPSGTEILSFCYYGSLVGFSANINSHGLIILCNALHANDKQLGEPKRVFARRLVECHDIDDALEIIKTSTRAQGQNFTFVQHDRIVGVETSATAFSVREISGNEFHCNTYRYPDMIGYEDADRAAGGWHRNQEGQNDFISLQDFHSLKAILSSHKNRPYAFCAHGDQEGDKLKTLGSIFFDCRKKEIWAGYGFTCCADLEKISFRHEW